MILGAGINGCAIARRFSQAGKRVLVIERRAVGSGTSSNSSKLIHGGLRYLETGRFGLVRESLRERGRLVRLYPDLVRMVPFFLPVYGDSPRPWWVIRVGLGVYDLFTGFGEYSCRGVAKQSFLEGFAGIRGAGLTRVYRYYDAKTDDLELTRRIAEDAVNSGCAIREGCEVREVDFGGSSIGIRAVDGNGEYEFETGLLINATGPWIDEVNDRYALPHDHRIAKVSGIHIVIDRLLVPDCMFLQTSGRRIFYMIPWRDEQTIIGTTERMEVKRCDEVAVDEEDIEYLLRCASGYLKEPLRREDVCSTFLGIRPLIREKGKSDATGMSREYKIEVHGDRGCRLVNVYGGKLTTALSLAEKVYKQVYR
ncbi:MAG: FAD-dependent oxidoreductase [Firmicutes bacterium]|nr:FAD-dependent oxidoreductase [Bacillota bacterium]